LKKITNYYLSLLLIVILTVEGVVTASDITGANYYGDITVTNNGTAAASVSTNMSCPTDGMIDSGQLNSSANNCAITYAGTDTAFMPGYGTNPWAIFVSSIGEAVQQIYKFWTGAVTGGKIRYFPGPTGMTIADSASMEPSNNFTTEISGRFDTSVGGNSTIVYKENAFEIVNSGSGNITAGILTATTAYTTYRPSGAGDLTNIDAQFPPATFHWDKVDEVVNDDDTTFVYTSGTLTLAEDTYTCTGTIPSGVTIDHITVTSVVRRTVGGGSAYNVLRLGGVDTVSAIHGLADAYATFTDTLARPGGGTWTTADLATLQVGIKLIDAGAGTTARCTQLYYTVYYLPEHVYQASVTAPVANGEREISVDMASPFLGIAADVTPPILPVETNLLLNAPFWQTELSTSPFTSIDNTGHAGTVTGATWTSSGYSFPASGNITFPAGASWNFAGDFAIEAWLWLNAINVDVMKSVSDQDWAAAAPNDWLVNVGGDNSLHLYIKNVTSIDSTPTFAPLAWNHFVVTRTGTVSKIYQNGVDVTATGANHGGVIGNTQLLNIGQRELNMDLPLEGVLGEVRIYSDDLSATQVLQNYNATRSKYTTGSIYTYSTLASVPDNSANWTIAQYPAVLYMESCNMTVGGNLVGSWNWEYGDTFTDDSGNGNDATPSFRTTSSDADVSAALSLYQPVSVAESDAVLSIGEGSILDTAPENPSTMYTENTTQQGFIFLIFDPVLASSAIPRFFFYSFWAMIFVIAAGALIFWPTQKTLIKVILQFALLLFIAAPGMNIWGVWVAGYYLIFGLCVVVLENQHIF